MQVQKMKRYAETINTFIKYGFQHFFEEASLPNAIKTTAYEKFNFESYTLPQRFRMAVEELGTTYIKFAQILSMRPDLVSPELIIELEKLQDQVQPVDIDLKSFLKESIHKDLEKDFAFFNPHPIGVASIGQVYEARLKDQTRVALKIQKPGIAEKTKQDLEILKEMARVSSKFSSVIADASPEEIIIALERQMLREFDYQVEGNNMHRFKSYYGKVKGIYIPTYFPEYSSKEVICQEFIEGVKVSNEEKLKERLQDTHKLVSLGTSFYMQQIVEKGFYHADPHAGNLLVKPDGDLCLIDYGMVGEILDSDRSDIVYFLRYMLEDKPKLFVQHIERIAVKSDIKNKPELEYQLHYIFVKLKQDISQINISELLFEMQALLSQNKITLPEPYYTLLRTLSILEGMARGLNPDFNLFEEMRPTIIRTMVKKMSPKSLMNKLMSNLQDLEYQMSTAPKNLLSILGKIDEGELKVKLELQGIEDIVERAENITNRISLTIIIVGLLVSSSIVLTNKIPPMFMGVSLIGILGYVISGAMGIWVMFSMIRKKP